MNVKGYVRVWDENGNLIAEGPNVVTQAGKNLMAALLAETSSAFPSHVAIGTNGVAPAETDTELQGTEIQRVAVSSKTSLANELTVNATIPASGRASAVSVQEFGIFNAATDGVMLARFIVGAVALATTGSFTLKWTLTLG